MEVLLRQSRELIEEERISFVADWTVLTRPLVQDHKSADSLREQVTALEQKLTQARTPLSSEGLGKRRLAEQDARSRPNALVRDRRQTAWERRLGATEGHYQSVVARFAEATCTLQLHEELICERAAVARAAARRHHEFALRRVATYLQQLVRTHRHGAELNDWLTAHRVLPDLPDWAREPAAGESGVEQILAGGTTLASDSPAADDARGQ